MRAPLLCFCLVPIAALAAPSGRPAEASPPHDLKARMEHHVRLERVVALAELLELDTPQALKVDEQLRRFDERRHPLREQLKESGWILARAAHGDEAAFKDVDAAIQ